MSNMPGPEKRSTMPERIGVTPKAEGQISAFRAVIDRLGNLTAGPFGNNELRQEGIPGLPTPQEDLDRLLEDFQALKTNIGNAVVRLGRGEQLPETGEIPNQPIVDLKHTDYGDLANPPRTRKP